MRRLIPILMLLQACTMVMPEPLPQPAAPQSLASCHAEGLEGLIGAPASLLPTGGSWSSLRIIRPGMMVTMDYAPTRLNVRVNRADIIVALTCG